MAEETAPGGAGRGYVVCATMRTGSTLLCDLLALNGQAGKPDEFFHPKLQPGFRRRWNADRRLPQLEAAIEATATPNGIFGAKILNWQRCLLEEDLAELHGRPMTIPHGLSEALGDVKYIYLRREDRLRQAISLYRARHTRRWTQRTASVPAYPEPRFDAETIREVERRLALADARWQEFFLLHGIEPLVVTYESLAAEREQTLRRVLGFLDLPQPDPGELHPSLLQKQADERTEVWIARLRGPDESSASRSRGPAPWRIMPVDRPFPVE